MKLVNGTGKAIDMDALILPIQMPRGYGGIGILLKKQIDNYVRTCHVGGIRIHCVEVKVK